MSTSVGFRYLYHSDYIDREIESWFHVRGLPVLVYTILIAACLAIGPEFSLCSTSGDLSGVCFRTGGS